MFDAVHLDDLDDGIGQIHGVVCAARRQQLAMIAAFDRREGWRQSGQTSCEGYLVARLGVSRRTAVQLVRLAHRLEVLPHVAAAYERGLLSDEAVQHAAELATPETDQEVAADAVGRTAAELEVLARQRRRVSRDDANEAHRRRHLTFRRDLERGMTRISGLLPDVDGERVRNAVERLARQLDDPHPEHGMREPFDSRCADALVVLAGARIADDHDPDRATVVVHVHPDAPAELADGTPLAADTARRICCDARVQAMLHGPDHRLLAVSVVEQMVPPALRRLVARRDRHCRFPGCDRRLFTHVHHVHHHADGGPTVDWNLSLLCTYHHRLVHEGGWTAEGDANGVLTFRSPLGTELSTGPPGLRPSTRARCQHLLPTVAPVGA
jgi:hypothetical protein